MILQLLTIKDIDFDNILLEDIIKLKLRCETVLKGNINAQEVVKIDAQKFITFLKEHPEVLI